MLKARPANITATYRVVRNGVQIQNPTVQLVNYTTWSKTSVKTANFKKLTKLQLRAVPWNNFLYSERVRTRRYASSTEVRTEISPYPQITQFVGPYWDTQADGTVNALITPDLQNAITKAKSAVLTRLKDKSIDLGQTFAERKQLVNMINANIGRLYRGFKAIRKGDVVTATKIFGVRHTFIPKRTAKFDRENRRILATTRGDTLKNNASNLWLEYQYGWRPLIQDIYGAAEVLAKTYGSVPKRYQVTASAKTEDSRINYIHRTLGGATPLVIESCNSQVNARAKYILQFVDDASFSDKMSSVGLTNPLNLAWELVPFSFVVDWFIPLGNYLNNLDASNGKTFVRGALLTETKELHSTQLVRGPQKVNGTYSGNTYTVGGGGMTESAFTRQRTILGAFPTPDFPKPDFSPTVSKALSSLALLNQLFSKSRR